MPDRRGERAIIVVPNLKHEPQLHLEGFTFHCQNTHGMQRAFFTLGMTRTAAE